MKKLKCLYSIFFQAVYFDCYYLKKIQYLYNRMKYVRKRSDSYAWKCMQYGICNHDFKNSALVL